MHSKILHLILPLMLFSYMAAAQEVQKEETPNNNEQPPPLSEAQKKQLDRQKKLQESYRQFLEKQDKNRNTPPSPPMSDQLVGRKPLPKVTESDAYLERLFQNKLILEGLVKPQAQDDTSYQLFMKGIK